MSRNWRSARLIYRALEKEDQDGILKELSDDPDALANASPHLQRPMTKSAIEEFYGFLDKMLLCCIICLPPPESDPTTTTTTTSSKDGTTTKPKPIPVGLVCLRQIEASMIHHRQTEMGINISKPYQGKGYGSEAIYWALDWGFTYAGLHRIELDAYGANTGAIKLYERLGFKVEGRRRDYIFVHGRFWDAVIFGMLEDEWRAMRGEKLKIEAPGGNL